MLATVLGSSARWRTMLVPAAAVTVAGLVWLVDTRPALVVLGHSTVLLHTDDVARVARARSRSVVLIHAVTRDRPPPSTRTSRDEAVGHDVLGSGTVVDPDGFVLTNAHVVDGAGAVYVRVADREEDAVVVAVDRECDLALLRAPEPTRLVPAPFGNSDRLTPGATVIAIGYRAGFGETVTAGVVSGTRRGFADSPLELIETDAAIAPGNSGGPLLDIDGRVIGIVTAMGMDHGENAGLNFAIPINAVTRELPAVRANRVVHPTIGIGFAKLSGVGADALGLGTPSDGLLITSVDPTGPAATADVQPFDILLGLPGEPPIRAREVRRRIHTLMPGTVVRLKLLRRGIEIERQVVVGSR